MTVSTYHKVILSVGILLLIHSAYSAAQHRAYLHLTEDACFRLPFDIVIQCFVSLLVICYSGAMVAGEFSLIRADIQMNSKTFETVFNCPSFYTFNHRASRVSPYFAVAPQFTSATTAADVDECRSDES